MCHPHLLCFLLVFSYYCQSTVFLRQLIDLAPLVENVEIRQIAIADCLLYQLQRVTDEMYKIDDEMTFDILTLDLARR